MKSIYFLIASIVGLAVVSGCLQPPSITNVVVSTITPDITASATTSTPMEEFAPMVTSSAYNPPPAQTTQASTSSSDPIVGNWVLTSSQPYSCGATIEGDGTGSVSCEYIYNRDIKWADVGQDQNQTFLEDYNITDTSDGSVYKAEYSSVSGELYSELLPDGTYFKKVN